MTAPLMRISDIDVFITYRCGLRCTHCFMGSNLGTLEMSIEMFKSIVYRSLDWGVKRVSLLGGEPTLYRHFSTALEVLDGLNLDCRVVTNGHRSCQRVLESRNWARAPHFSFSIEGSCAEFHDRVRGSGSFASLSKSVELARRSDLPFSGILSVCRENYDDVVSTIRLCRDWGMESLNIHYVTSRGFAKKSSVLTPSEWESLVSEVTATVYGMERFSVHIERTFGERSKVPIRCAVQDRSNLMFLPDGRVFHCMMFIDMPDSHAFEWVDGELVSRRGVCSEVSIVGENSLLSCPALSLVDPEVSAKLADTKRALCIYDKEHISSPS